MIALGASGFSTITLLTVCFARREIPALRRPYLIHYGVSGLTGLVLSNLFGFTSLQHIPAGFFSLLIPLSPMLTVLGAMALRMEKVSWRRIGGSILGLVGIGLAMAPGAALPDPEALPWALLAAFTPVWYAVANIAGVKLAPRGAAPLALAAGTCGAAALIMAVIAFSTGQIRAVDIAGLPITMAQGVLLALAYLIYFRSLATQGGVVTSQVGYIVTITGLIWGFAIFGEVPGWLTIPAAALVFIGLALVTLPGKKITQSNA
jgi:drug/metabolite transporter (DMT)-like permease